MNINKVQELLQQWAKLLDSGEQAAREKAVASDGGIDGRIKRTKGSSIVFDIDTFEAQTKIQNSLCREAPLWVQVIRSQPGLMDGYQWSRRDYIELYFEHFRLVIRKIQRLLLLPGETE